MIFSGFLILLTHMSDFMRMISYLSPIRYGLENMVLAMYSNNRQDTICPDDVLYCHFKWVVVLIEAPSLFVSKLINYLTSYLEMLQQFWKILAWKMAIMAWIWVYWFYNWWSIKVVPISHWNDKSNGNRPETTKQPTHIE